MRQADRTAEDFYGNDVSVDVEMGQPPEVVLTIQPPKEPDAMTRPDSTISAMSPARAKKIAAALNWAADEAGKFTQPGGHEHG